MDAVELSDEQLAADAAREGANGLAFAELMRRYRDRVWKICYRLLGNEHDAHDAAQEVFVRLFFQRGRFEGRSKFSTWVHGIAVRVCLTFRRGRGRRQRHESSVLGETLDERSDAPEASPDTALDLDQILEVLNEEDRALLILKYAEEYTYDELAEIFEISPSACKMRISRAREKLQEKYPDLEL
ncbi:MAG: sigma-70 family RNA polymerase sigma factor [Planctomycetaceae bacterium]|nr:sigma-70 family RNA polymerase sigma factor [Planctomycetaceae bacterium]